MERNEKWWELIHEYKLLEMQARVHLANSNLSGYIDCLDMMSNVKAEIDKCHKDNCRKCFLHDN